jgi:hypothetical protein
MDRTPDTVVVHLVEQLTMGDGIKRLAKIKDDDVSLVASVMRDENVIHGR